MRNIDEVSEEYFLTHPEEIAPYLEELLEEYQQDGDITSLLANINVLSKVLNQVTIAVK